MGDDSVRGSSDVFRIFTDLPAMRHRSGRALGGDDEPVETDQSVDWTRNDRSSTFEAQGNPASVASRIREALEEHGWTVHIDLDPARPPRDGADPPGDDEDLPENGERRSEDVLSPEPSGPRPTAIVTARRAMSRAAQLNPLDEQARKALGMWSIRDRYPEGVSRGGCMLANFDYECTATFYPSPLGGLLVEACCEETISPFKGVFPFPDRFSIPSEIDAVDPAPQIREALGSS